MNKIHNTHSAITVKCPECDHEAIFVKFYRMSAQAWALQKCMHLHRLLKLPDEIVVFNEPMNADELLQVIEWEES